MRSPRGPRSLEHHRAPVEFSSPLELPRSPLELPRVPRALLELPTSFFEFPSSSLKLSSSSPPLEPPPSFPMARCELPRAPLALPLSSPGLCYEFDSSSLELPSSSARAPLEALSPPRTREPLPGLSSGGSWPFRFEAESLRALEPRAAAVPIQWGRRGARAAGTAAWRLLSGSARSWARWTWTASTQAKNGGGACTASRTRAVRARQSGPSCVVSSRGSNSGSRSS